MTERQKTIWTLLSERNFLTARQIGEHLHISDRTVRSEIREINKEQKREIIQSKKGQGYWIDQEDQSAPIISAEGLEEQANLEWRLVRSALFDEGISYLELGDELYISDTLLSKIIHQVNRQMERRYPQGAIRKRNNFLVMEMNEEEKREYYSIYVTTRNISHYFDIAGFQPYFEYADIAWIQNLVLKQAKNSQIPFFDTTLVRLMVGTAVMTERLAAGYCVEPAQALTEPPSLEKEVLEVVHAIEEFLGICAPKQEYLYFQKLFHDDFYYMDTTAHQRTEEILQEILTEINVEYGFDFSKEEEFCKEMMAQITGTLRRTRNGQLALNPVLQKIKAQYPLEYDMAIFIADRLHRKIQYFIGEDEVGMFAIHIIWAMESNMMRTEKKVVLVNPFGKQVKELIRKRLEGIGECRMKIIKTYSFFNLPKIFPKDILAVLTTVPLPHEPEDVPVILCRNFLDYREKEKLLTVMREEQVSSVGNYFQKMFHPWLFFADMDFSDKREALDFMCHKLTDYEYVENGFFESVMQREEIAPTSFETGFAIAHGMENTARRTVVCVCTLKNWMAWGEYNVKIIFLFALSSSWNHTMIPIYNLMIDHLMSAGGVRHLLKKKDCKSFCDALIQPIT